MKETSIYQLPHNDEKEEIIYLISASNRTNLSLASNFPYELWINNKFIGSGGHRCTDTEIYIDNWDNLLLTDVISIKYQWFNYNKFNVWYRRIFPNAIFVDMISSLPWTLNVDKSIKFGEKICAQLPHQNIIMNCNNPELNLILEKLDECPYTIKPLPVQPCKYIEVNPKLISEKTLLSINPNFEYISSVLWPKYQDYQFKCDTYDLGYIALHRFEVDTKEYGIVMYYGEVSNFEDLLNTRSRLNVKLADGIDKNMYCASPFGTRGCRYVNVIYPINYTNNIQLRAQRYQYPFKWLDISTDCNEIILACKNNLIACVDGGVVDTCWRERTQWTGDARISLMVLKSLTSNTEIIEFVLDQISQSYDETVGMVEGAYPSQKLGKNCDIPTYHLLFCYAVIEYYGYEFKPVRPYEIVIKSINLWKQKYLKDGIIEGMPGWYFLDWDKPDVLVTDEIRIGYKHPHSVCNAMFYDICKLLNIESGININKFNELFCWNNYAYTINPSSHPNLHANSLILSLSSFANTHVGVEYLTDIINNDFDMIKSKVTPYFAYFIAKALQLHNLDMMIPFIKRYYGPIVDEYGTIYEKIYPTSSMAHGWSIGIASLLVV